MFKFYLFIYFWLHWVSVTAHGLSLVAASGGHSSPHYTGFSLRWPLPPQSMGSRHAGFQQLWHTGPAAAAHGLQSAGSAAVTHGPSCSVARGILPDQGPNPRPLHRQADSQPLRHQASPRIYNVLGTVLNYWHAFTSFIFIVLFLSSFSK